MPASALSWPVWDGSDGDGRSGMVVEGAGKIKSGDPVVWFKAVAVTPARVCRDGRVQAKGRSGVLFPYPRADLADAVRRVMAALSRSTWRRRRPHSSPRRAPVVIAGHSSVAQSGSRLASTRCGRPRVRAWRRRRLDLVHRVVRDPAPADDALEGAAEDPVHLPDRGGGQRLAPVRDAAASPSAALDVSCIRRLVSMATQERDELLHLVQEPEDEVHELLALVRRRDTAKTRSGRPGWVGLLHEGPNLAKRAKETLRAELGGGQ